MIIFLLILSGGCLFIFRKVYKRLWSRDLTFRLDFDSPYTYAGEEAGFSEVIENRKKLPVPFLEIGFRIQKGILLPDAENVLTSDYIYKRDLFSLSGMESISRHYTAQCHHRGCYSFSQMTMNCRSILFWQTYIRELECDQKLYVYPAKADISDILPTLESLFGEFESSRRYLDDPFAFSGIRPYTLSDPMKTINWKACAKTGELMVNTYTSVLSSRIMVCLDVSDRFVIKKDELLEKCISIAASLCRRFIGQGMETGIFVNAGTERASFDTAETAQPADVTGSTVQSSDAAGRTAQSSDDAAGSAHYSSGVSENLFFLPPARGNQQLSSIEHFLTRDFKADNPSDFGQSLNSCRLPGIPSPFFFLSMQIKNSKLKSPIISETRTKAF